MVRDERARQQRPELVLILERHLEVARVLRCVSKSLGDGRRPVEDPRRPGARIVYIDGSHGTSHFRQRMRDRGLRLFVGAGNRADARHSRRQMGVVALARRA